MFSRAKRAVSASRANARTANAAKKAANNAAKKAATAATAAANAAKKAAANAAAAAASAGTTALGRGIRMKNVTNKVKSLAVKATALGGSAYALFLKSGNSQALTIAATCLVLIYIAHFMLGRPKNRGSVLQSQINAANRNLAKRIRKHPHYNAYRALMKAGTINQASAMMTGIRGDFSQNTAQIAVMRVQLNRLLTEVIEALPIVAPNRSVASLVRSALPYARTALEAYRYIQVLHIESMNAETAHIRAKTAAEAAHAVAVATRAEQQTRNRVRPWTAKLSGVTAAVGNVTTTVTKARNVLGPVAQAGLSAVRGAARLYHGGRGHQ